MSLIFSDVTFGYSRRRSPVLADLTWHVPAGRTVLLGPNGAGKSTLLSLGADALRPWRGEIGLQGQARGGRAARRRAVGWMPQRIRAVAGLTAREQVAYAGWLKGLSRPAAWEAAEQALQRVDLAERANEKTTTLSGGQLRRVGLAQVLVHQPAVLLLDEPTVGLDPAQRARFRAILADLNQDTPVVVSTHQVDDLGEMFDTVIVFGAGRIRWQGTSSDFLEMGGAGAEHRRAELAYSALVAGDA